MGAKAQGADAQRYQIIPRVLVFVTNRSGRVLLLQGAADKKIWAGLWNGIGGHVEAGETVLDAARRELAEEAGLNCSKWLFCGQVLIELNSGPGIGIFVFRASGISGEMTASEEGNLAWFDLDEALKLSLVEDLPTLLPLVLRHKASQPPFWARYQYNDLDQLVISFSPLA